MTIGIVLVACLAARIAVSFVETRTSTLSCTSSARGLGSIRLSLSVAILNHDVFALDITEISQPLPECLEWSWVVGMPLPDTNPIRGIFFGCCADAE